MNWMRIFCSLVLCTLFTAVASQRAHGSLLTQEEPKAAHEPAPEMQQPEPKPETPEAKPEQQPEKQENAKPEKQEQNKDQSNDQNKNLTKEQKKEQKKQQKQNKDQSKVNNNSNPERTNAAAGNANGQSGKMQGKGGHIPDDKFRANFGKGHTFVINRPVIVNNQPTFQYGGYSFIIAQPWPMGWAYTDSCYIDYIDGEYFLFDLLHPGVQIEVFVNA
jgi:DNA mismatch repair ATPase MutL